MKVNVDRLSFWNFIRFSRKVPNCYNTKHEKLLKKMGYHEGGHFTTLFKVSSRMNE